MLLKRIACTVPPASRESFSTAQTAWSALRRLDGFVAQIGGWRSDETGEAVIIAFWDDARTYGRFMHNHHDDICRRNKQAETYTSTSVACFDARVSIAGSAAKLTAAVTSAGFVRIAECTVRPERLEHFLDCQRNIWNPAMGDAGILGGVFARRADATNEYLVCTLWPDTATHYTYATTKLPALRLRAQVDADCTAVTGRSFVVERAWRVMGASDAGVQQQ